MMKTPFTYEITALIMASHQAAMNAVLQAAGWGPNTFSHAVWRDSDVLHDPDSPPDPFGYIMHTVLDRTMKAVVSAVRANMLPAGVSMADIQTIDRSVTSKSLRDAAGALVVSVTALTQAEAEFSGEPHASLDYKRSWRAVAQSQGMKTRDKVEAGDGSRQLFRTED